MIQKVTKSLKGNEPTLLKEPNWCINVNKQKNKQKPTQKTKKQEKKQKKKTNKQQTTTQKKTQNNKKNSVLLTRIFAAFTSPVDKVVYTGLRRYNNTKTKKKYSFYWMDYNINGM